MSLFQDRHPPPGWIHGLLTAACILSIALPPGFLRVSSGAIISGIYLYMLGWTAEQSRDAYLLGVSTSILVLRWIDLVVLHRPERDFWKKAGSATGRADGRAPNDALGRLKWFFFLWNNQRGVGWNIEPDCLPPPVGEDCPRSSFIKYNLISGLAAYLGLDAVQLMLRDAYALEITPFFEMPMTKQVFISWAAAFKLYCTISLLYSLGAVTVLVHIFDPVDWPPMFGSFHQDAWSIRRMWGKCWHQMMRRPCAEAGRITKEACGLRKGTFGSRYSQIWIGFAMSALIHHAGATVSMFADGGYWQAMFFMVQPVGIMFEDGIIEAGKRFGLKDSG
ncbi:uncharacterized protein L3040_002900 [Drepanopeziza brunnea f. sp. 'multigermtubi']|uniref:uncharacterized protein n=1 Tax=Drepanopeziza brunnea f. sp. 'multigermtubi' TaxID=698441 RepID=UPI0023964ED4|nr:hypothetical protein L3040_002900 [Drepanopeziza brunnea f. sp. 'multigermtubi']